MKVRMKIWLLGILLMNAVTGFANCNGAGSSASDFRDSYEKVVKFLRGNQYSLCTEGDVYSTGSWHETKFSMPESKLEEFKNLFWWTISVTGDGTYYAANGSAGHEKTRKTFFCGKNNEKSITFGDKINQNECLAFYSTHHGIPAQFRMGLKGPKQAVYAVVWEVSKGKVQGSVYMLKGDNLDNMGRCSENDTDDSSSFLEEFSNIRTAFKIMAKGTSSDDAKMAGFTGLANKLLALCKKKGANVPSEDFSIYANAIAEMMNCSKDNFVRELLDQSLQILSKNKKQ